MYLDSVLTKNPNKHRHDISCNFPTSKKLSVFPPCFNTLNIPNRPVTEGIVLSQASLNRPDTNEAESCGLAVGKSGSQPQSIAMKLEVYHMDFYTW